MTAKEFYENQLHDKTTVVGRLEKDEIIELMQAYHESKMKEVTDEDIERQIKQINRREALCTVDYYSTGFIAGAKAMRDGKIKHKEE